MSRARTTPLSTGREASREPGRQRPSRCALFAAPSATVAILFAGCASLGPATTVTMDTSAPIAAAVDQSAVSTPLDLAELDAGLRATPPYQPYALSPYVAPDAFAFAAPPVEALRARLVAIERVTRSRGIPVTHTMQALYGSGFLHDNPVGNDLDYEVAVNLGAVRLDGNAPEVAAGEVLGRMQAYLQVLESTFRQQEAPEMSVLSFKALRHGEWRRPEELTRRMTASLADVAAGRPHVVLIDSLYGLRVPTVLSPEESYVHETTRIELLSNQVRSVDWMTPGIRGFQVMLHFACDLEILGEGGRTIRDFPFHPTFMPAGRALELEENILGTIPVDRPSAEFFSARALSNPASMVEGRLAMAAQLLSEVDRNLAAGDPLKALKRLYQVGDALAPALPADELATLRRLAAASLFDRGLLLCGEISTLAGNAAKVAGNPVLLGLYRDSLDFGRTVTHLRHRLERAGAMEPERLPAERLEPLAEQTRVLGDLLRDHFPTREERDAAKALLEQISAVGEVCEAFYLPPADEVRRLANVLSGRMVEAGLRPLPVYGLADGTLGVLDDQALASLGVAGADPQDGRPFTEHLLAADAPPFEYRPIVSDEIPHDRRDEPLGPSLVLWLRADRSAAAELSLEQLEAALDRDHRRFLRIAPDGPRAAPETARAAVAARFGAAGARAWTSSHAGGEGLLALLGEPDQAVTEQLLDTHLALLDRIPTAASALPPWRDGDDGLAIALGRGLATTSERILQGLAVGRTTGGRRGLTATEAATAQGQLADLVDVLIALAQHRVEVVAVVDGAFFGGRRYEVRESNGAVSAISVRTERTELAQARLTIEPPLDATGERLQLRFDVSRALGAAFDLQFSSARLDWGVHGALPGEPMISDHHFWDGVPRELQRAKSPRARHELAEAFAIYLSERFVPERLAPD